MKNSDRLDALVALEQERGRIDDQIARHVRQLRGVTEGGRVSWAIIAQHLSMPKSTTQARYADIAPKERITAARTRTEVAL